jgi:hypothetical protein
LQYAYITIIQIETQLALIVLLQYANIALLKKKQQH